MRGGAIALVLLVGAALTEAPVQATQVPPLEVVLVLGRAAYLPGEPINFTVHVRNRSNQPASVSFATSQRFDIILQSTVVIDRWSRGRTFAQVADELRWGPEETVRFADQWLPRTSLAPANVGEPAERPIAPGVYLLSAELSAVGLQVVSRPVYVVIGWPIELPEGCTTFAAPFSVELPAIFVASLVEPSEALESLWQQRVPGARYTAYAPLVYKPSDLDLVNGRQPLHVCMLAPGRIILP